MPRSLTTFVASVVMSFVALVACGCESTPQPTQVASIPSCEGSQDVGCQYGMPLCAADKDGTCVMCHCTAYQPLASDAPAVGSLMYGATSGGTPLSGGGFGPR
jgi:hypothetical protein